MKSSMFSASDNFEILQTIIELVSVFMMNDFIEGKFASKVLFHNLLMHPDFLSVSAMRPVSERILAAAFIIHGHAPLVSFFETDQFRFFGIDQ